MTDRLIWHHTSRRTRVHISPEVIPRMFILMLFLLLGFLYLYHLLFIYFSIGIATPTAPLESKSLDNSYYFTDKRVYG